MARQLDRDTPEGRSIFFFGAFEADQRRFELRLRGAVVPAQRHILEIIFFFLRRPGEIVTKHDLVTGPGRGIAVGDSALYRGIMLARRALSDGRRGYIATVRGQGYRFDGEVRVESADAREVETPLPTESTAPTQRLVGRNQEMKRLRQAWARTKAGRGCIVVVSGPAGIGKTSLVEAFAQEIVDASGMVTWGRAWDGGGAPPLLPWADVARDVISRAGAQSSERLPDPVSAGVQGLLPDLFPDQSREWDLVADAVDTAAGLHARFRVFEAISRFLVATAVARGALVVVLEDLHAADEASCLLLQFLRRSLSSAPLLVVVTSRPPDSTDRQSLRDLFAAGTEDVVALSLTGLSPTEVQSVLNDLQGTVPTPTVCETVHRLTEGNPLWVGELVRAGWVNTFASGKADEPWRPRPVPDRAVKWIADRLEALSPEARRLVQAASVIGRAFSWPLLLDLLGQDARSGLSLLRQATECGLIDSRQEDPGTFRFLHALIADAIYQGLSADGRCEWHARVVAFGERAGAVNDTRAVAQLAHHSAAAIPLLGLSPAISHGLAAARWARKLYSYELAAQHFRQVLGFLQLLPSNAGDPDLRWSAWRGCAEAEALAGRAAEAMASYEEMMTACRAAGANDEFARAALSCFEYVREIAVASPVFHGRVREALGLCEGAVPLRARILAVHSLLSFFYAPYELRVQQVDEALGIARASDDAHTLLSVLRNSHLAGLAPTRLPQALARAQEMTAIAARLHDDVGRLEGHFWLAQHALDTGDGETFQREVSAHADLARIVRHPLHLWYAALLDSVTAFFAGRLTKSAETARAAAVLGRTAIGATGADSYVGGQLLAVAWLLDGAERRSHFAEVGAAGARVLQFAPGFMAWRLAELVARREADGLEAISSEYQSVVGQLPFIPEDAYWLLCAVLLASLAVDFQDVERIQALSDRLSVFAEQHVSVTSLYLGPVSFHLGRLAEGLVAEGLVTKDVARLRYRQAANQASRAHALPWRDAAERALERLDPFPLEEGAYEIDAGREEFTRGLA